MDNIYIVTSPLQLLNCIEASFYYKTKNNILIIINTNEVNFKLIGELLKIYNWDKIIHLDLPSKFYLSSKYKKKVRELTKNKVDKVFIGEYRMPYLLHLLNSFKNNGIFLVDDGMSTLSFYNFVKKITFKNTIKKILYKIFFYNVSNIKYNFFTMFDIDNSTKNNYDYIKEKLNSSYCMDENTVLFIGQPLVLLSVVTEKYYYNYMKNIINSFPNKKIVYVMHRRDNLEYIKKIAKKLEFEFVRYPNLLELELLNMKYKPCCIITFYSTAIYTLNKMFDNIEFIAYKIDKNDINSRYYNILDIDNYYLNFINSGISVRDYQNRKIINV